MKKKMFQVEEVCSFQGFLFFNFNKIKTFNEISFISKMSALNIQI